MLGIGDAGTEEIDMSNSIEFKPMIVIKGSGSNGKTILKPLEGNEHLIKDAVEDGGQLMKDYKEYMKKEKDGLKTYSFSEWMGLSAEERKEAVEQTETESPTKEVKASDETLSFFQ